MGINAYTLDYFYEMIKRAGLAGIEGKWLLELGNQRIRANAFAKYGIKSIYSKTYFLSKRCNHHSIDINGLDGAVPLDMGEPVLIERFLDAFDIITDFGCMEHIEDQRQAWQNIHDMGKVGCVYIHAVPLVDSWPGHCKHYYSEQFFENLCKENSYKLLYLRTVKRTGDREEVLCTYVKEKI